MSAKREGPRRASFGARVMAVARGEILCYSYSKIGEGMAARLNKPQG